MLSISPRGPNHLWPLIHRMVVDEPWHGSWRKVHGTGRWDGWGPTRHVGYEPTYEMTRIAISLRLWLRRAIKRINERTMMRIVDMVNYDSLRALYKPIRIVELD